MSNLSVESSASSTDTMPIDKADKRWGPFAVFGNTASAAVATWCFITGGVTALFVGAVQGTIGLFAGTLLGVFIVCVAALPGATRYGLEAVRSTRPIFGTRGTLITVTVVLVILIGWNSVLTIALGDAFSAALVSLGVISSSATSVMSPIFAVVGVLAVFALLWRGSRTLRWAGPAVAIAVLVLALWMGGTILANFGIGSFLSAEPLDPLPTKAINYTYVLELGVAGGIAWWPYTGSLARNGKNKRGVTIPTLLGLGFMMALVLIVGLLAGLAIPESGGDPTSFLISLGGPVFGVLALFFLVFANVGTVMVGTYAAALGLKQIAVVDARVSWPGAVGLVLLPVAVLSTAIPTLFMANYSTFVTAAGILIGPICGMQIVDNYLIRRQVLDARALFTTARGGRYWYFAGVNPAGIVGLAVGIGTYLLLQNPFTYEPGLGLGIIVGSIPGVITAGLAYWLFMRAVPSLWSTRNFELPALKV